MDYELRLVVEKVAVSSQEVVRRDTVKVYDVKRPESILEIGLRHESGFKNKVNRIKKIPRCQLISSLEVSAEILNPAGNVAFPL